MARAPRPTGPGKPVQRLGSEVPGQPCTGLLAGCLYTLRPEGAAWRWTLRYGPDLPSYYADKAPRTGTEPTQGAARAAVQMLVRKGFLSVQHAPEEL